MPHLNRVGATSACLREAASAKAGRPLERDANPALGGTPLPSSPEKVRHYLLEKNT
jgi:hypothetical protein